MFPGYIATKFNRATSNFAWLGAIVLASIFPGESVMGLESPDYTVVYADGNIEYRQYEPYLVAETTVASDGRYTDAGNEGFRRLFRYITGNNTSQSKIAMTVPVEQGKQGEKIAMTTPVEQSSTEEGWVVSFMVPRDYTLETAPRPTDPRVRIREVPGELRAVLRYSGRWTDSLFRKKRTELIDTLESSEVTMQGEVQIAFYDPPYMLPFLRRNEVQVRIRNLPLMGDIQVGREAGTLSMN